MQGVIGAWEAKVAQLNDEIDDLRVVTEEAHFDKQDALAAARKEVGSVCEGVRVF